MNTAKVVIGANFGDEGKGLMTDYFASKNAKNSIVVRFNGGCQAGHTVQTPEGKRHVFSHFSSATLVNCPTFLSRFFIVNPMFFVKELASLRLLGVDPTVFVDPRAIVSTPFDVFLNQLLETKRGTKRHGSCGLGINETVSRCYREISFKTTVAELFDLESFKRKLRHIQANWLPLRLKELGIAEQDSMVLSFLSMSEQIIDRFLSDVSEFLLETVCSEKIPGKREIIFEGAQGLLLDEFRIDNFPHLTRSRTGLSNVIVLAREMQVEHLEVTYVSRTYLTRHGAGPLKNEAQWSLRDDTNVPNQFQGSLRFADLDLDQLRYAVSLDLNAARYQFPNITAHMALTCADQLALPESTSLPLPLKYVAFGPTRVDVRMIEKEFDSPRERALASTAVV